MMSSDPSGAAFSSRAGKLSKLLNLSGSAPEEWGERSLSAMARHQLAAPLGFDLRGLALKPSEREAMELELAQASAHGIESFQDLLLHQEPPLELLRLAKDFFKKRTRECQKGSAEWQVAYLFYLLTIVAAGARAPAVSTLTPGELVKGIGWALDQPWVDDNIKCLLRSAAPRLQSRAETDGQAH